MSNSESKTGATQKQSVPKTSSSKNRSWEDKKSILEMAKQWHSDTGKPAGSLDELLQTARAIERYADGEID